MLRSVKAEGKKRQAIIHKRILNGVQRKTRLLLVNRSG
jgi:hypothetical protein